MDRLTGFEVFVAIVETGSFVRAAARLRMSAAMVTEHLARLEQRVGVRLLDRTTRRVDLTESGQRFLELARIALSAVEAAEDAMHPDGPGITGRVRVDAPLSVGHKFILPALKRFHELYPGVVLELSLGDRGTAFRAAGFDVLLRVGEAPPTGWKTIALGATRLICLASNDYVAAHGAPASPKDLNEHKCILYAGIEEPGGDPWALSNNGRRIRVRPAPAFIFNDGAAILDAARDGLGIACNLELLARDELKSGDLRVVLEDWASSVPVVLMCPNERFAAPQVRAAMEFLSKEIDWGLN